MKKSPPPSRAPAPPHALRCLVQGATVLLGFALVASSALASDSGPLFTWNPAPPDERAALQARAADEGGVRVLVRLADPAVPWWAGVLNIERTVRRREIAREQEAVLADLEQYTGNAPGIVRRFLNVPYLAIDADSSALRELERSSRVVSVSEDRLLAPALNESVPIIEGHLAAAADLDGSGQVVAVLDTGIDSAHPFLSGRVVDEACFSAAGSCPDESATQLGPGSATYCDFSSSCFHGTHVAGIVAGSTTFLRGVAPGAEIIAVQVFSEFTGSICDDAGSDPCALAYTSDIVAGLEYVEGLGAEFDIAAVNMSIGGGAWTSQTACDAANPTLKAAIDSLRSAGIASVVAAGNEGLLDAMGAPGCISSAVSVGATDDLDQIASFSNSAPFLSLLAPGVSIASSVPSGLVGFAYGVASGTSMATPHVAGAWAIARQANSAASVDDILSAFQSTGIPIEDVNSVSTPRIRAFAAAQEFETLPPASCENDADSDGVCDPSDNCSLVANPGQADSDQDGFGNTCDADYDNDGSVGGGDFLVFRMAYGSSAGGTSFAAAADHDSNDQVDSADFIALRDMQDQPVGPSGLTCAGTIPCVAP